MYTYLNVSDDVDLGACTSCQTPFTEDDQSEDANPCYGFTRTGKGICESCCDDRWTFADCCQVYVLSRAYDNYNDMCNMCVNENFFTCESCGQLIHNDYYYENGYCESCYNDNDEQDGIHGYHSGVPWGERTYHTDEGKTYESEQDRTLTYFGIEFECEGVSRTNYYDRLMQLEHAEFAHAEQDSSLNDGMEVITEPATMSQWVGGGMGAAMRDFHEAMLGEGITFEGDRIGAHVHVSRVAFKNDNHLSRFALFGTHNVEYMRALSGRESEGYAHLNKYERSNFRHAIKRQRDDRSRWCNLTNRHTIEVRLFAGSNNYEDYLAHIEWIAALIEYTKDLNANDCLYGALLAQSFTQWLADSDYTLAHKLAMSRVPVSLLS